LLSKKDYITAAFSRKNMGFIHFLFNWHFRDEGKLPIVFSGSSLDERFFKNIGKQWLEEYKHGK